LNLVRSVRRILEAISPDYETINSHAFDDIDDEATESGSAIISSDEPPTSSPYHGIKGYEAYQTRLAPLISLEQKLIAQLSEDENNEEREPTRLGTPNGHWLVTPPDHFAKSDSASSLYPGNVANGRPAPSIYIPQTSTLKSNPSSPISPIPELCVRTTSNWKKALSLGGKTKCPISPHSGELEGWWEDPNDPVHVINQCGPAMQDLWADQAVRQRLAEKRLRLEDSSGL
jgi:guanine nucleotide-binding protein subunit alpha